MIGIIIGLLITVFSTYYLIKEKKDRESRKIYSIFTLAGIVILVLSLIYKYLCSIY